MFKMIGGVVVYGCALYGLVKYLERTMVKEVIHPAALRNPEKAAGATA